MVISNLTPADGGSNDIITFTVEFKVSDGTTVQVVNTDATPSTPLAFSKDLPATKSADADNDVVLDVDVTGGRPTYSYKWFLGSTQIDSTANPTAATATLLLLGVTTASSGSYRCEVTDSDGNKITSTTCVLTVTA